MSRRIAFCLLAASAALIATPAIADRECFEQPCHQQDAAEPAAEPLASVASPADADVSPALDASAAVEKLAPAKALPQVVATPQPAPKLTISPPTQSLADESLAPREPARLAPRYVSETRTPERVITPAPSSYVRATRVSSPDPTYTASVHAPASAAIVVVVPGALYTTGRYMIAPSAKIISIDSDD